jgi:Na+-transporting methylmalonyl-CoA/oxaloacetate decarboxylase gamma subunit
LENSVATALVITVIGMTLLFLSLLLFYGLLSLLTATVKDRPSPVAESASAPTQASAEEVTVLRAAAIAIALARAEAEQGAGLTAAPPLDVAGTEGQTSPWWAFHHQRQLARQGDARRDR